MTIPSERSRAIVETQKFLYDLINPMNTPRIPRSIRERASRLLRHYPNSWEVERAARKCPDILGKYETE